MTTGIRPRLFKWWFFIFTTYMIGVITYAYKKGLRMKLNKPPKREDYPYYSVI